DLQKLAFQENEEDIKAINFDHSDIETIISDYNNTEDNEIVYFTKNLVIDIIYHMLTLMKYLPTSHKGVTIVFNTQDWKKTESAFNDIQYAMGKPGGETEVFCSVLISKSKRNLNLF
ncbi:2226_t:CDS:2, partial [Ambispora gerdemannii]